MEQSLAWLLGTEGPLQGRVPVLETRDSQVRMAAAVEEVMGGGGRLLVEAGPGTGKTFAYLLPALRHADCGARRVVISTWTRQLQEQIVQRDLPVLQAALGLERPTALLLGRENYLCRRRAEEALGHLRLASGDPRRRQHEAIVERARRGVLARRGDLPFEPLPEVWRAVRAERGNCLGQHSPFFSVCSWQAARRTAREATILVVNHALLMADLRLRRAGSSILPPHSCLVVDEAHHLEEVAAEHLGTRVGPRALYGILAAAQHLLDGAPADAGTARALELCQDEAERFFQDLERRLGSRTTLELAPGPAPALAGCLHTLAESLGERAGAARDESSSLELHAVAERALALGGDLAEVFASPDPAAVRWIVREADGTLAACAAPIDPAPILAQELFTPLESAVLTSATLAAPGADAGDDPFEFARRSTGIGPAARGLMLPSPFDYSRQASIVIDLLPDPSDEDAYREALGERIPEHVRRSSGRAFVLFTSKRTMEEVAPRVRAALEDDGIELLVQGAGAPPSLLLEQFRRQQPAALFGLASFWEGVDVPGPVLSHVIVTRLPFAVPDHPRDQAKAARCRRGGGEPFRDLAVPQAVLRWKQGFGRLIRNREDRGVVTVLDRRIVTRRYGRLFLDALPPCPRFLLRDGEEVAWDPAP